MNIHEILSSLVQIIIPLGILNVWFIRQGRATAYRGGNASSLKDEFTAYGLPVAAFYVIGALKLSAAAMLLLGFVLPALILPGAALMSALMLGALLMHAKVGDAPKRSVPAALMLCMSVFLLI
ncbi:MULTISPECIES: DoxX family protein [unclassified Lentimonas]|uniref:DoxX family protein n=1 Tax=unclassified Lentimonas TaxID=2630993 RepID=UPI00132C5595|nr:MULTISPECIES: DoxX family protein [unclassified Lentimonas]CAA6693652.1 Unannotated [Lentimonas sp. CC10]CAA6697630.1 Unannotated [Lentimonas sp. CC19]CAA7071715.1 Unannotated [Lentimonas sp. CC11]